MNLTFSKALLFSVTAVIFFNAYANATGQEARLEAKTRSNAESTTLNA